MAAAGADSGARARKRLAMSLLQHGVNDRRINVGQSNKMAARLMPATASGKPVLLDLEYAGGHGAGLRRDLARKQRAHRYAFLLWQMDHPEFQPM